MNWIDHFVVGPGLAMEWISPRPAARPWGFFVSVLARASSARHARVHGVKDWIDHVVVGPGLAVKWIKP
ncbi:MAG: hypothetical protein ACK46G_14320, partial [Flavobacteriales bacterium]